MAHSHSLSETRIAIPMWDSSDPKRAPMPMPLPPGRLSPERRIFGENTPPSATVRAMRAMDDDVSSQLAKLTTIVSALQAEMSALSRRSKDNAADLTSLKEATKRRDEDVKRDLTMEGPFSLEGTATVAMLEKVIRDMATRDLVVEHAGRDDLKAVRAASDLSVKGQGEILDALRQVSTIRNQLSADARRHKEEILGVLEDRDKHARTEIMSEDMQSTGQMVPARPKDAVLEAGLAELLARLEALEAHRAELMKVLEGIKDKSGLKADLEHFVSDLAAGMKAEFEHLTGDLAASHLKAMDHTELLQNLQERVTNKDDLDAARLEILEASDAHREKLQTVADELATRLETLEGKDDHAGLAIAKLDVLKTELLEHSVKKSDLDAVRLEILEGRDDHVALAAARLELLKAELLEQSIHKSDLDAARLEILEAGNAHYEKLDTVTTDLATRLSQAQPGAKDELLGDVDRNLAQVLETAAAHQELLEHTGNDLAARLESLRAEVATGQDSAISAAKTELLEDAGENLAQVLKANAAHQELLEHTSQDLAARLESFSAEVATGQDLAAITQAKNELLEDARNKNELAAARFDSFKVDLLERVINKADLDTARLGILDANAAHKIELVAHLESRLFEVVTAHQNEVIEAVKHQTTGPGDPASLDRHNELLGHVNDRDDDAAARLESVKTQLLDHAASKADLAAVTESQTREVLGHLNATDEIAAGRLDHLETELGQCLESVKTELQRFASGHGQVIEAHTATRNNMLDAQAADKTELLQAMRSLAERQQDEIRELKVSIDTLGTMSLDNSDLRSERDTLQAQVAAARADLTGLEVSLGIRREELRAIESKADSLEKRVLAQSKVLKPRIKSPAPGRIMSLGQLAGNGVKRARDLKRSHSVKADRENIILEEA